MNLLRIIPFTVASLAFCLPAFAAVATLDRVVAIVNKQVLTENELDDRLKSVLQNMQRQGMTPPPTAALRSQALERMITDSALAQYAQESGVRVDDATLDRTVDRLAEQNRMSTGQFREALARDGVNFRRFREEIRQEILINRLKEREIDARVQVSDSEIDTAVQRKHEDKARDADYQLAHILVPLPEGASAAVQAAKKKRIEAALAEINAGKPFDQVAATYSEAPDALKGGLLGWRNASRLPNLFLEAIAALQNGQITPILKSGNGYHLVKLLDRKQGGGHEIVQQTQVRHILIKVNDIVSEADAKARIDRVRERLSHGGNFAELARLYSEDGSAAMGGDLGWVSPSDLVPEFERVMDSLKPNELSEATRSPFGWHLIQVQARRSQDVSGERERQTMRQALKTKKAEEMYDDWLRQVRDRAFIVNKLSDE